jgi:hypothetical protein
MPRRINTLRPEIQFIDGVKMLCGMAWSAVFYVYVVLLKKDTS